MILNRCKSRSLLHKKGERIMHTYHSHNYDDDVAECTICFGCLWILSEGSMPFSALDLNCLLPGDEIIRCPECNPIPETELIS